MKRSEMITKIRDWNSVLNPYDDREFAEALLDFIEGLGMQPPFSNPKNLRGYDLAYASTEELYVWEPEDV